MKRISIIGLGWLGNYLATEFIKANYEVNGTVTTESKVQEFQNEPIKVFQLQLNQIVDKNLPLLRADIFIITIPPSALCFVKGMCALIDVIVEKNKNAIIYYMSSTSVYGNQKGKICETDQLKAESEKAKKMLLIERYLLKKCQNCYILRLGGLVGEDRHPIKYLAKRKNIVQPQTKINLVHRQEVLAVVLFLLNKKKKKKIYNLVCPKHPMKKEFYQKIAQLHKRSLPIFDDEDKTVNKVVVPKHLLEESYPFIYESPFDFPMSKI